jgi:hypothetical protein
MSRGDRGTHVSAVQTRVHVIPPEVRFHVDSQRRWLDRDLAEIEEAMDIAAE